MLKRVHAEKLRSVYSNSVLFIQPWHGKKLTDWFVPMRKQHNDIVINSSSGR